MKTVQKKSGLVLGNKAGFSFIEIVVVILILAVTLSVAVPGLLKKEPKQQRHLFVQQLDGLLEQASYQALMTRHIQKITFDTSKRELTVVAEKTQHQEKQEEQQPAPAPTFRLAWPENLDIEQFFIQGVDEFSAKNSGKTTNEIWFYIIPDAMAQEVIINGRDTKDVRAGEEQKTWSFVLNPFTLRFKIYEEFQSPSW